MNKVAAEIDWPDFIEKRTKIFDQLVANYKEEVAKKERKQIKVKLPDGKEIDGIAWQTTPFQIAQGISKGLADKVVIAKVNDEVCFGLKLNKIIVLIYSYGIWIDHWRRMPP